MDFFYESVADGNWLLNIFEHDSTSIETHFHSSIEFLYNLDGKTKFFYSGTHYILEADDIYAVPSRIAHANACIGKNRIVSIVFSKEYFNFFENDYPGLFFAPVLTNREKNKKLRGLIFDYFQASAENGDHTPLIGKSAFVNTFLYELTKIYPLRPITEKKTNTLVIDILSFIHQNYTQPLTLELLANKFNYAPPYFSSIFNKYIGMHLHTYINNYRIKKVMELLSDHQPHNIISTALNCGFNSQASFYRALQKYKQQNEGHLIPAHEEF